MDTVCIVTMTTVKMITGWGCLLKVLPKVTGQCGALFMAATLVSCPFAAAITENRSHNKPVVKKDLKVEKAIIKQYE